MSKIISGKGNGYICKQSYESSFLSDVIKTYNKISDADIEAQIAALKNAIIYIKQAAAEGMSPDDIEDAVLYNMSNLFERIKYPTLADFYQVRTLEYMMDLDLDPYIEEMLTKGLDYKEFKNVPEYSANVANNVYTEIYGMLKDFMEEPRHTKDTDFLVLCEKTRNGKLTIDDKNLVSKYIKKYLKQIQIGKATYWDTQKKDLDACRRILIKHKDDIFDIKKVSLDTSEQSSSNSALSNEERKSILDSLKNKQMDSVTNIIESLTMKDKSKVYKKVSLKDFVKSPFIGDDRDNNVLIIMSECLRKLDETSLENFYDTLIRSERCENAKTRERCANSICNLIGSITFNRSLLRSRDSLMERISTLMTFYRESGCLGEYCETNNNRLNRIYLGDLQIDEDTLFSKFVNTESKKDKLDKRPSDSSIKYFINDKTDFSKCFKGTPVASASDEAVIGMSAFYTNRMTKKVPTYSMLGYILDKTAAIEKICDDPDLEYEDLQYTREDIATYMAMYKCFQRLMVKKYFQDIPLTEEPSEAEVHKALSRALRDYKNVYENIYPDMGFYFERDIDFVMMDARLIQELYDLKSFSVKSLLYTALTDKKKNIMNWGFVPEDEQSLEKFVLLGFDIKTLNTPLFVHMKREDLVEFLEELTGTTQMQVYEGANNMYSYSIKQRITAQVLYPLSKEEKKKLYKLEGVGNRTDYYKHVKWLQQGKDEPVFGHAPGSRVYDFKTKKIEKVKKNALQSVQGENDSKNKLDNEDR